MTLEAGSVAIDESFGFGGSVVQTGGVLTSTPGSSLNGVHVFGDFSISDGMAFLSNVGLSRSPYGAITQTGGEIIFADFDGYSPYSIVSKSSSLGGLNSIGGDVGGVVEFGGDLELGSNNSTILKVGGSTADRYVIDNGVLTYGGALTIDFQDTYAQADDTLWSLFSVSGGVSGEFAGINGAGNGPYANLAWSLAVNSPDAVDQAYGEGVWLSEWTSGPDVQRLIFTQSTGNLVVVPEPSTVMMAVAGLAYGGFSVWRRRKQA